MFNYNKNRISLIVALALLFFAGNILVCDAYEIQSARTYDPGKTTVKGAKHDTFDDYTDYDSDAYLDRLQSGEFVGDDGESLDEASGNQETFLDKKLKKIFNRKKNKENADELEEEAISEESGEKEGSEEENQELGVYEKQTILPRDEVKVDPKNKFQINADNVIYDEATSNVYADGNVEIIAKEQGTTLKAEHALLDKTAQTLTLTDNVKIIKGPTVMFGESMIIDLNEQNILMDNPTLEAYSFQIKAQEGFLIENDIEILNGNLKCLKTKSFPFATNAFARLESVTTRNPYFDKIEFPDTGEEKEKSFKIDTKEIVITTHKDHSTVLLKGANVFYNNHKIARNFDFEITSDKEREVVEMNAPEVGNLRNFGTYIGYGFVNKIPGGDTLKLMPVLAYSENEAGLGIIARYRNRNGILDGGWNSASTNLVVRGKFKLANGLNLNFGRHAYIPEGFMGARRSGYAAQLHYSKRYSLPDLKASFTNSVYAGWFKDYQKKDQEDAFSTTRFRYMFRLSKNVFKYKNKEQDFIMSLGASVQGAATVYGTGENHGIIRVGPNLTTRYKRWESSIGYYISGIHGETPFWFDRYRYGKSTITMNEKFTFNKYFAMGMRLYITPKEDNPQKDMFTECRWYFVVGPPDAKVAFSYDLVRDVSHLDFMFLLGSDNTNITFDKLSTVNAEDKQKKRDFYRSAKKIKIEKPENI